MCDKHLRIVHKVIALLRRYCGYNPTCRCYVRRQIVSSLDSGPPSTASPHTPRLTAFSASEVFSSSLSLSNGGKGSGSNVDCQASHLFASDRIVR